MPKRKKSKLIYEEENREEKDALGKKRNLKDIANDIIVSYEARLRVVGGIVNDTHNMMDGFRGKREAMAKELQEILAKCESLRKKDFNRMMADIVARQNEREKQVKEMLENFRREEEMVAERLKELLAKGEEIRIKDFKKMMVDIRQEQEKRVKQTGESITGQLQDMRGEVHIMLDNFKKERQSVAAAWHEMLGLFRQEKPPAPYQSKHGTGQANPEAEPRSTASWLRGKQVHYGAGPGNPGDNNEENIIKHDDDQS